MCAWCTCVCKQSLIYWVTGQLSPGSTQCQSQRVLFSTLGFLKARRRRGGAPCWHCSPSCAHIQGHTAQTLPSPTWHLRVQSWAQRQDHCSALLSSHTASLASTLFHLWIPHTAAGGGGGTGTTSVATKRAQTDSAEPNTAISNSEYCTLQTPPPPFDTKAIPNSFSPQATQVTIKIPILEQRTD